MAHAVDNAKSTELVIRPILKRLNGFSDAIEASAVMTRDGFNLASVIDKTVDVDRLGAMCASTLSLADKTSKELSRGSLKQVMIEGDNGYIMIVQIGSSAVLAVVSQPTAHLGKVFLETKRVAKEIADTKVV